MGGMQSATQGFPAEHPLLGDRSLLEDVLDIMYASIQRVLFPLRRPDPRNSGRQRTIVGGVSAEDVLRDAFDDILRYSDPSAVDSWQAIGVTIAKRRAMDALTAAQKHLGATDHRAKLVVVSGDAEASSAEEHEGERSRVLDLVPDRREDPEEEAIAIRAVLDLRDLARELLDDRELKIYFDVRFLQRTRSALGGELGLTPQRVGQILHEASRRLEAHPTVSRNSGAPISTTSKASGTSGQILST